MNILNAERIHALDSFAIAEENIPSHELMERAALLFSNWFLKKVQPQKNIFIFCGTGNNGGDGLCIARHLFLKGHAVRILFVGDTAKASPDFLINFHRIKKFLIPFENYDTAKFPETHAGDIIIDAIFGTGLSRRPAAVYSNVIEEINKSFALKISVDVPSGFFCAAPTEHTCIKADLTYSFECPKLGFFFPENFIYTGVWKYQSIGLLKKYEENFQTNEYYTLAEDVKKILRKRRNFDHKGTFGHALLIAGSSGMEGAASLCGRSCLVTGCGLVTICSEAGELHYPELMHLGVSGLTEFFRSGKTDSAGAGPGMGKSQSSKQMLEILCGQYKAPVVLDADALNILAENKEMLSAIPAHSILTPHPKEFERLFGKSENSFAQLELQKTMSLRYQCFIILKRAYSCISTPEGELFFNSTGNPGMATAGSGDVLTGMLIALLAQHYTPKEAAITGTFLHGLAGDMAMKRCGGQNLIASDIIDSIQAAYGVLLHDDHP